MKNASNISSEQELLQLRNEGKISEAEYDDLLGTMKKSSAWDADTGVLEIHRPAVKSKKGKFAFSLMLAGIVLPILGFVVCSLATGGGEMDVIFKACFFACVLVELPAFVLGIVSWPDVFGKATVASIAALVVLALLLWSPQDVGLAKRASEEVAMTFPLDDTEGLITQTGVQIDKQISSDGNGSLRIEAKEPTTVRLFETGDIDIENARLLYRARVRTENVEGQVYLEMWCHFAGLGDFFSKGLGTPVAGTTNWTTVETPFFLKKGENPDNVKLNLVIDGKGTAWIDDIGLLKGPLE